MRRRVSGGDLVLAVMIVAIVAMMIVPVPSYVLDVLIGANLAGAVILLLEAVYIRRVLDLSTFPALLLITTLFRLAINISTTRLILLRGDAGRIVESFGSVVVSGSVLVGAVIFLVITIVQYLVIAKGAERAAEVSARFTLDSLPGRQMSIEADLRNGRLDAEQATLAREALKRESQLFGALEGAMKFVKGDAIATMVILVVNIVGGLARGVGQLGMPLGEAVRRYTLLTIGDGLISQIPALLITAAAGMVMTRVESPQGTSAVGREIGLQLLRSPKSLWLAAGLCAVLGLVPGLPLLPFWLIAALVAGIAYGRVKLQERTVRQQSLDEESEVSLEPPLADWYPIAVTFNGLSYRHVLALRERLDAAARTLRERYGVPDLTIPLVPSRDAGGAPLALVHRDVPICELPHATGLLLPAARRADLERRGIELLVVAAVEGSVLWVDESAAGAAVASEEGSVDVDRFITREAARLCELRLAEYIDAQIARRLLDAYARHHAEIANDLEQRVSTGVLARVLSLLLRERIPIAPFHPIALALAEWSAVEDDAHKLAQRAREALRQSICHRLADAQRRILVLGFDFEVQLALEESVSAGLSGPLLVLEPELRTEILRSLESARSDWPSDAHPPTLLVRRDLRHLVRHQLLPRDTPFAVLADSELAHGYSLEQVGVVGFPSASARTA